MTGRSNRILYSEKQLRQRVSFDDFARVPSVGVETLCSLFFKIESVKRQKTNLPLFSVTIDISLQRTLEPTIEHS